MSRTDPTPAWRVLVPLAGLVVLTLQMLTVLNPAMVEVNAEESSNAGQAVAVYGLGNHMECAVLSTLVLLGLGAVPAWRRAAVAGLAGGLAVFVGYSAAFATGVGALWLFLTRRWLALLAWCGGVGLGLTALLYRSFLYRTHRIRTL